MNMESGGASKISSTFQVAEVSRPLMSVSKICDQDMTCVFDKREARVLSADGTLVASFQRDGGLYTCQMKLKAPSAIPDGFVRREP